MMLREMLAPTEMINTTEWAKGIYILTLQSSEGRAQKKVVVR